MKTLLINDSFDFKNGTVKYWKYQYISIYFLILSIDININEFSIKQYIIDICKIKRYFPIPKYWFTDHWAPNIHVPKCSGKEISSAKMSMVPKIPCAKMSLCRKVLVSKCPWRWNVYVPVRLQGRNMHVPKCPGDEMSLPKCLLTKCQEPKWWEAQT